MHVGEKLHVILSAAMVFRCANESRFPNSVSLHFLKREPSSFQLAE
jgi:hypothetical protein